MTASRRVVATMAFAAGAVVANLYYAQPLVASLAQAFHASEAQVGVLITLLQLGYAIGLATVVPLGDLVERRRLLLVLLAGCAVGLAVMGTAPALAVIASAAVLVGLTSVAVQVVVPFAAHLAEDGREGRVVGTVMSGLLVGILASRTVSGLVAEWVGWRWVFGGAALLTLAVAAVLWRELPVDRPTARMSYPALLRSVLNLIAHEPELRRRMLYGGCAFAAFSVFWSTSGFLLARPPYHWSEAQIGLFALLGAVGVLAARFAGGLADRGHAGWTTGAFALLAAVSFAPMAVWPGSVVALGIGVILLDLGVQGLQITNQSVIYALRPDARSRITTAYMTAYFLFGAVGSGLATATLAAFGWAGVCAVGAAFPTVGALVWAIDRIRNRRSALAPVG